LGKVTKRSYGRKVGRDRGPEKERGGVFSKRGRDMKRVKKNTKNQNPSVAGGG